MTKSEALILLVNSMTKAEKRSFTSNSSSGRPTDYVILFEIINKNKAIIPSALQEVFQEVQPKANFNLTVNYLYKVLLDTLLALRENNDNTTYLNNQIGKAQILFEKAIYDEALDILDQVKEKARKLELEFIFLTAARLELKFLHMLNFPNISESELLSKHLQINESLKIIRRVNEQSVLHELMSHRVLYRESVRSNKQKEALNDLVVSEMSIMSASNIENFEIKKLHQLFQSAYLINVGDYKSALRSYYELNNLFEENSVFWANPPIYYMSVLEGILQSLRGIKEYDSMDYFINKIKSLSSYPFKDFQLHILSVTLLYELFPLLDRGDFKQAKEQIDNNWNFILEKEHLLPPNSRIEILLYLALAHFGLSQYKEAHKILNKVLLQSKNFYYTPLYRTIRLVKLMVLFELDELDDYEFEVRSFSRSISQIKKAYRLEHIMLRFFNKGRDMMRNKDKEWKKLEPILKEISNDVYEKQILRLFDFTAWIESKMTNTGLKEVIKKHHC